MQKPTRGNLVRTLREQAGLSQEELAVRAQVSRATVQNIERDRTDPRRAVLRRLAEALGTDVAALTPDQPMTLEEIADKRAQLLAALAELDALERGQDVG
ncbi:helix-turn-helix transcriptional regulator [Kribbella sp. NPDC050469]|uniref:helix-turn-helix transcriptional regulator n=1 Tax=Kribbella sp. NPDC050469 TaxID=3364116 RepID=UPI0037A21BF8